MKNIILPLLVAVLFVIQPSYGKKAPEVEFEDLNGKKVKVSDLKGKPAVLVFWQVLCHSCEKELKALSKTAEKYRDKVQFYAVVIGTRDLLVIEEKKMEWNFSLPVLIADYKDQMAFKVYGTPMTYVLDGEGNVVAVFLGSGKEKQVEQVLDKLLNQ
ncbi:MAG: TlpA family protein disulfide reductase [Aquificae bacterium]|nr:TlpA family protein disulfide reductase [Aquificota bacterium]